MITHGIRRITVWNLPEQLAAIETDRRDDAVRRLIDRQTVDRRRRQKP